MKRLTCQVLTFALVVCATSATFAESKPVKDIKELDWIVGTWAGEEKPLDEDFPGFAKKGTPARLHVTLRYAFGDTFIVSNGALKAKNDSTEIFHEVWGRNPETGSIKRWFFGLPGWVLEGQVVADGDTYTVKIMGEVLPVDEDMVKQFGKEKLSYSGDVIFKAIDKNTYSLTVDNVMIGGKPFPWPNAGVADILKRVE